MSEYINLSDWKFNLFKYLIRFPNIYTLYIYMNIEDIYCDYIFFIDTSDL